MSNASVVPRVRFLQWILAFCLLSRAIAQTTYYCNALNIFYVAGGVNTFHSTLWTLSSSNSACLQYYSPTIPWSASLGMYAWKLNGCQVYYEDPYVTGRWKRDDESDHYDGPEHLHSRHWQVKEIRIPKNWQDNYVEIPSTGLDERAFGEAISNIWDNIDVTEEFITLELFNGTDVGIEDLLQSRSTSSQVAKSTPSHKHLQRHVHGHH